MNPYAGMRRANRYLAEILTIFSQADYEVVVRMTCGTGDARRFVREKCADMDLIVCAGGDGTFNETISGMLEAGCDVPVGYIPCGSTNDFANSLKLSSNILQAARDIVEGAPVSYDVGKFGDSYFSYVASFGAFTKASYSTPQNIKNALGHTAYILEGIQELSQLKPTHVRIQMENAVIEDDFLFGAVSNSTSVAGVLTLSKDKVDMSDGKLEIMLVKAPKDLTEVADLIAALQKQTYNCAAMTFLSTESVKVKVSSNMDWTLDGERQAGVSEVDVTCVHRGVQVIRPC